MLPLYGALGPLTVRPPFALGSTLLDGLTAWWHLNQPSGIRYDSVGSNHLTDVNTVGVADGKIGRAADFEADNLEYLNLVDNADVSPTGSFTWSCWVNAETLSSNGPIIGKDGSGQRSYLLTTSLAPGLIAYAFDPSGSFQNAHHAGGIITGRWHHVVWGWDASDGKTFIYVDDDAGVFSAGTLASIKDSTADLRFGSRVFGGYYDGLLIHVGLWNDRVLTSDERTELNNEGASVRHAFDDNGEGFREDLMAAYHLNEESGVRVNSGAPSTLKRKLEACWKMEEASGNSRVDEVAGIELLEIVGPTASGAGLDGDAAYGVISGAARLRTAYGAGPKMDGSDWTATQWYRPDDLNHVGTIFGVRYPPSANSVLGIACDATNGRFTISWPPLTALNVWIPTGTLRAGVWWFVVTRWNEATETLRFRVYDADGVMYGSEQSTSGTPTRAWLQSHLLEMVLSCEGRQDETTIYSRELTDPECDALAAPGVFYPYEAAEVFDLTDVNTVGYVSDGKSGNAAKIIQANLEHLKSTDGPSARNEANGWTEALWFRPRTSTTHYITSGSYGAQFTLLFANTALVRFYYYGSTGSCIATRTSPLSLDNWHLLIGWWDPADGKAYIQVDNGTPVASAVTTDVITNAHVHYMLGFNSAADCDGDIDEAEVIARVFSADERTGLWAAGVGRFYDFNTVGL